MKYIVLRFIEGLCFIVAFVSFAIISGYIESDVPIMNLMPGFIIITAVMVLCVFLAWLIEEVLNY